MFGPLFLRVGFVSLIAGLSGCSDSEIAPIRIRTIDFENETPGVRPDGFKLSSQKSNRAAASVQEGSGVNASRCLRWYGSKTDAGTFLSFEIPTTEYRGRRLRVSSALRIETAKVVIHSAVMLEGAYEQRRPHFEGDVPNLSTTDWRTHSVDIDVPPDATLLVCALGTVGGVALVDDVVIEDLGSSRNLPAKELTARESENLVALAHALGVIAHFHPSDQVLATDLDRFAIAAAARIESAEDAEDLASRLTEVFAPIAPSAQFWAGTTENVPPPRTPVPEGSATALVGVEHIGFGKTLERKNSRKDSGFLALLTTRDDGPYTSTVIDESLTNPPAQSRIAPRGSHALQDLGGGVACRIPVVLERDASGTLPKPMATATISPPADWIPTTWDRATRLAAVIRCWNVLRYAYPYFDVIEVDWESVLRSCLARAAKDDALTFDETLSQLAAALRDGHASATTPYTKLRVLPIDAYLVGDDLVLTSRRRLGSGLTNPGDRVISIDGQPIARCIERARARLSHSSPQFFDRNCARELFATAAMSVPIEIEDPEGARSTIEVKSEIPSQDYLVEFPSRPAPGTEVGPGILYVDLCGTSEKAIKPVMSELAKAKGLIFDVRGYPDSGAMMILEHLTDTSLESPTWNKPIRKHPDPNQLDWDSSIWSIAPKTPRYTKHVAFLTDGRAVSYAETIMSIVEAYRLGEIVGETTAATNGNANLFEFHRIASISFTGMQVLKRDGSRFHGVGVRPTVPCQVTREGIIEGVDEVLDAAVTVLTERIEKGS